MELEAVVRGLCDTVPNAIGAIVCDYEGESVVHALGAARLSPESEIGARSLMPRAMEPTVSVTEFMLRLAGAEPCALLRQFEEPSRGHGIGGLVSLQMRYQSLELLVERLPDEYYVVLLLRPPSMVAAAHQHLRAAAETLTRLIA